MNLTEKAQLLDEGYMLLERHMSLKRVRDADDRGSHCTYLPQIRAQYGARRKWYVLEKGFASTQARDQRMGELLQLPKHLEYTFC